MAGVFLRDCDHIFGDWLMIKAFEDKWEVYDRSLNLLMVIDRKAFNFVIYKDFNKLSRIRRKDLYYKAKDLLVGKEA